MRGGAVAHHRGHIQTVLLGNFLMQRTAEQDVATAGGGQRKEREEASWPAKDVSSGSPSWKRFFGCCRKDVSAQTSVGFLSGGKYSTGGISLLSQ